MNYCSFKKQTCLHTFVQISALSHCNYICSGIGWAAFLVLNSAGCGRQQPTFRMCWSMRVGRVILCVPWPPSHYRFETEIFGSQDGSGLGIFTCCSLRPLRGPSIAPSRFLVRVLAFVCARHGGTQPTVVELCAVIWRIKDYDVRPYVTVTAVPAATFFVNVMMLRSHVCSTCIIILIYISFSFRGLFFCILLQIR